MKKIGLLTLVLVIALGAMGIGYAMWSDEIYVDGDVTTATVCWEFVSCSVDDDVAPPPIYPTATPDLTCNDGFQLEVGKGYYWPLDKNVSWGECTINRPSDLNPDGDSHTLTVHLYNTYPSNFNAVSFYLNNCGTIPIKVWKVEVLDNNGVVQATFDENSPDPRYVALDLDGDQVPDIELQYGNNFGAQLEPGPSGFEYSFWIHTLQEAPQDADLEFSLKVYAMQWNEYFDYYPD
jgi:hypothetical protein